MKEYYKLIIDKTSKPMGRGNWDYEKYDQEIKEFNTLEEVKQYLSDQYYYCKTHYKTFTDNVDGQTGWIYAYKSDPSAYGDCHYFNQDWINIYKIKSEPVLIS